MGSGHLTERGVVPARISIEVDGAPVPLVVDLGPAGDPTAALAGIEAALGGRALVVDRSGVSARGALIGRDLLHGDQLVAPDRRQLPALFGVHGPLRGAGTTLDRERSLGRGGRFGPASIEDPEVSRAHLRTWPTPGAVLATDVGSTNGTTVGGRALTGPAALRSGDLVGLGASTLLVVGDPPRGPHVHAEGPTIRLAGGMAAGPVAPGLAAACAAAAGWSAGLWRRTPGEVPPPQLRLGTDGPRGLAVDLVPHRTVAVTGPPDVLAAAASAWLLQLAVRHRPTDLELAVVGPDDGPEPLRALATDVAWLPHHRPGHRGAPGALLDQLRSAAPGRGPQTVALVAAGATTAADREALDALAREGLAEVVWLAPPRPVEGHDVVAIELAADGRATLGASGTTLGPFAADLLGAELRTLLFRLLAPLVADEPPQGR